MQRVAGNDVQVPPADVAVEQLAVEECHQVRVQRPVVRRPAAARQRLPVPPRQSLQLRAGSLPCCE